MSLSDDVILEQAEYTFDNGGNAILAPSTCSLRQRAIGNQQSTSEGVVDELDFITKVRVGYGSPDRSTMNCWTTRMNNSLGSSPVQFLAASHRSEFELHGGGR